MSTLVNNSHAGGLYKQWKHVVHIFHWHYLSVWDDATDITDVWSNENQNASPCPLGVHYRATGYRSPVLTVQQRWAPLYP